MGTVNMVNNGCPLAELATVLTLKKTGVVTNFPNMRFQWQTTQRFVMGE